MIVHLFDWRIDLTAAIFLLTYAGIAAGHVRGTGLGRTGITLIGAIAMLAVGAVSLDAAVQFVNYPSILMLFGLFLISAQLRLAGFYGWVAIWISSYLHRPAAFLLLLMTASGVLSAFLNNDIVCAAFTPVVIAALTAKRINPVPFLIALAISSNIGCAATVIGNAQNVLIGQIAHLGFAHYMAFALPPVAVSMLLAYGLIWGMCRKKLAMPGDWEIPLCGEVVLADRNQILKGLFVTGVVVALYFTSYHRSIVTLAGGALLLISKKLTSKRILSLIEWEVLLMFIGLFVIVGSFENTGLAQDGLQWLQRHGVHLENPFVLTLATGALSNLINNSAAVMLLVHFVDLTDPVTGYLLALANTFGGNLLMIGSVANIIVVKSAQDHGIQISFREFARYGIPIALASYAVLFLWILARV
ncbi:MAG TPA: anion transporter [Verrucomicrobia bacterium]|nr:MAG: hypothetical protein A2X46_12460 [Lentisphaerae bacterium GWF2_57_35]HBA84104.1 anion transporter [Verrucomicrobiota bacterium]